MGLKARVKATGEIIEVSQGIYFPYQYVDDNGTIYTEEHLEILPEVLAPTIDYWTRLEHQAAIAAMQGMLSNPKIDLDYKSDECMPQAVAAAAYIFAHTLVENMKEEKA